MTNRRLSLRMPARMLVHQLVGEQPRVAMSFNLSPYGLYLYQKPYEFVPRVIRVELTLPGAEDSIWAKGEVRFLGRFGDYQGIGLAFTAMANKHFRMIRDWAMDARLDEMRQLLGCPARELRAA